MAFSVITRNNMKRRMGKRHFSRKNCLSLEAGPVAKGIMAGNGTKIYHLRWRRKIARVRSRRLVVGEAREIGARSDRTIEIILGRVPLLLF